MTEQRGAKIRSELTEGQRSRPRRVDQTVRPSISVARLHAKVWLERDGRFVIGEGGAELLAQIARHGSLAEAARKIGWSYRHAWGYLRRAEAVLGARLTTPRSGKGPARGMILSPEGRAVLSELLGARERVDRAIGSPPRVRSASR